MQGLLFGAALGQQALERLAFFQPVPQLQPFQTELRRGLDHPEGIEVMGLAPLHPERRLQHRAAGAWGEVLQQLLDADFNPRVQQGVQQGPVRAIPEHTAAQGGAVQRALRPQDGWAEGSH